MRKDVPGTTHTKCFDRHEPAILTALESASSVRRLRTGNFVNTGSSRRVLKLRLNAVHNNCEAMYDGWLYFAGIKRRLFLQTHPLVTVGALTRELAPVLAEYGITVSLERDVHGHQQEVVLENTERLVELSRAALLALCGQVHDYIELAQQFQTEAAEHQAKLDAAYAQQHDAEESAIKALIEVLDKTPRA